MIGRDNKLIVAIRVVRGFNGTSCCRLGLDDRELLVIARDKTRQLEARDRINRRDINRRAVERNRAGGAELDRRTGQIERTIFDDDRRIDDCRVSDLDRTVVRFLERHGPRPADRELVDGNRRIDRDRRITVSRQRSRRIVVHTLDFGTFRHGKSFIQTGLGPGTRRREVCFVRDRARVKTAGRDIRIRLHDRLGLRIGDRIVEDADDIHNARFAVIDSHSGILVSCRAVLDHTAKVGADLQAAVVGGTKHKPLGNRKRPAPHAVDPDSECLACLDNDIGVTCRSRVRNGRPDGIHLVNRPSGVRGDDDLILVRCRRDKKALVAVVGRTDMDELRLGRR